MFSGECLILQYSRYIEWGYGEIFFLFCPSRLPLQPHPLIWLHGHLVNASPEVHENILNFVILKKWFFSFLGRNNFRRFVINLHDDSVETNLSTILFCFRIGTIQMNHCLLGTFKWGWILILDLFANFFI